MNFEQAKRQMRHRAWANRVAALGFACSYTSCLLYALDADLAGTIVNAALATVVYAVWRWDPPLIKDVRITSDGELSE